MKKGFVYLIGAGPGDPGLITVKGAERLASCDVIVYDQLASSRLLEYASPSAERIFAGKSGSSHAMEQAEINSLLVRMATLGKRVARLKGGDPFVLGRGGEEGEALRKHKVDFEVVPGVTSAIAVPACAGIPVTHRGLSSSVAIITGHEDPGKKDSSLNWEGLATGVDTLVILMGVANLGYITRKLIEHGRAADTPAAVIKDGTLPSQVTLTGKLCNIAALVKEANLAPPAIIVVGKVVRLRSKLRWFDLLPLFGRRVLVTRAGAQAGAFEKVLVEKGAFPVRFSAIEIRPPASMKKLDEALGSLSCFDWVAFTSVNGVEVFFKRLQALGMDARSLHGVKIAAIGPITGKALRQCGICPDYVPATYTGDGLVEGLENMDIQGQRFLLPRADIADGEITGGLKKLGALVTEVAAYRTVRPRGGLSRLRQLLQSGNLDVVTFTSASTVTNLIAGLGQSELSAIKASIACIGPKTAEAASRAGLKVDILASEQTIPGLIEAMEKYFAREGAHA